MVTNVCLGTSRVSRRAPLLVVVLTLSWLSTARAQESASPAEGEGAPVNAVSNEDSSCPPEVRECCLGVRYWAGLPEAAGELGPAPTVAAHRFDVVGVAAAFSTTRGGLDEGRQFRNYVLAGATLAAFLLVAFVLWLLADRSRWYVPGWVEMVLLLGSAGSVWYLLPPLLVRPAAERGAERVVAELRGLCGDGSAPEGAMCTGNGFATRFPAPAVDGQPAPQDALTPLDPCLDPANQEFIRQSLAPGANDGCLQLCDATGTADALLTASEQISKVLATCDDVRDHWRAAEGVTASEWTTCKESLVKKSIAANRLEDWGLKWPWAGVAGALLAWFVLLWSTGSATGLRAGQYAGK